MRGFGMVFDLERGTNRKWFVGDDGIKRWADNNEPTEPKKSEDWEKVAGFIRSKIGEHDSGDDSNKLLSEITDIIETAFCYMPSAIEKIENGA